MKVFNKYSIVRVKLRESGYKILENMRDKIRQENISKFAKNAILAEIPVADENGYVEMRFCDMMSIFGSYMNLSNSPIEEDIQISDEYLKDSEDVKGNNLGHYGN